jgi:hypothetical protein
MKLAENGQVLFQTPDLKKLRCALPSESALPIAILTTSGIAMLKGHGKSSVSS